MIDVIKRHKITFFVLALILLLLMALLFYFTTQGNAKMPMKGVFVRIAPVSTIL